MNCASGENLAAAAARIVATTGLGLRCSFGMIKGGLVAVA